MVASSAQWMSSTTTTFSVPGSLTWRSRAPNRSSRASTGPAQLQQLPAELIGDVEQRPERARGEQAIAGPPGPARIRQVTLQLLHQRRLADARLPGHQHQPPVALPCLPRVPGQRRQRRPPFQQPHADSVARINAGCQPWTPRPERMYQRNCLDLGTLPCRIRASCVAGFQDECAEEEGTGGPQGDDAETLPGSEQGRLFSPVVARASWQAGRGPIWSRCRARGGLEMTAAAIGNRYSTPSTRPMAAAESRTAAASAKAEQGDERQVQDRTGGGPEVGGRGEGRVSMRGGEAVAGQDRRPASAAPATASAEAASTGAVSTAALANNQVSRRGIAVSDSLIIPVLYSLPTASTPATATTAWPGPIPVKVLAQPENGSLPRWR